MVPAIKRDKMIILFSLFLSILNIFGSCKVPVKISQLVVTDSENGNCSPNDLIRAKLNITKEEVKQAIRNTVNPYLNQAGSSNPCHSSGSRRVAYLDMSDPGATCPSSWTTLTSPVRGCGRAINGAISSCDSAIFPVSGLSYSAVCGRILGYQRGSTDAFQNSVYLDYTSIDSPYVDGVSVTHGPVGSRQHIWTFASALYEEDPSYTPKWNCACTNTQYNWPYQIPGFVQNNYFCDTGNPGPGNSLTSYYYPIDPLWDGAGCGANNTCCQFNNPPWFQSTLPGSTTDDIELRICHVDPYNNEDTVLFLIEIYVQ